jgi:2'-5' RNA ligase
MTPEIGAPEPLILTLKMDGATQAWFDRLREEYFPPERNYLRAHLTMFHKLPGEHAEEIFADIEKICAREHIRLTATGLRFLGKGVAYELVSPNLEELRRDLAARWKLWLGAQDRQRFKPHVTVQNKVSPEKAHALHARLEKSFSPFEVEGEGLALWRYVGGPWEPVGAYLFEKR